MNDKCVGTEIRTFTEYPTTNTIYVNNSTLFQPSFRLPHLQEMGKGYVKVKAPRKKRNKRRLSGCILNFCCCYVCIIGKQVESEE